MVPSVLLTGSAVTGVAAHLVPQALMARLPQKVMLGRNPPRPEVKRAMVHLSDFWTQDRAGAPLPASTNWRGKAAAAIARMYLNDQYGDCVWASNMHLLGVWSANDPDSGGIIQATDAEVLQQYHQVCGPGDPGCVITDTLDWAIHKGWIAGGKVYHIDGYAAVDWTNQNLVKTVQVIGGASKIGINLPQDWTRNSVWDTTTSKIVGGHDVLPMDYDESGVYVASWGRIYLITWRAFMSTRWLEEQYFVVGPNWYGADRMSPSGFDYTGLMAALQTFKQGGIPDWQSSATTTRQPSPVTTAPPGPLPPVPLGGDYILTGTFTGTIQPRPGKRNDGG